MKRESDNVSTLISSHQVGPGSDADIDAIGQRQGHQSLETVMEAHPEMKITAAIVTAT